MSLVTIALGLIAQFWPVILGALGFVVALLYGRRSGVKSERAKRAQEELKARTQADEIEDAIAGRAPGENREKLKRWGRG